MKRTTHKATNITISIFIVVFKNYSRYKFSLADLTASSGIRVTTLMLHRTEFCAWPPVASYHEVTSLLDCVVLCLEVPDCLYVNVKEVDGGMFICGVSSFLADMPTEPIADPQNWNSYLIAQWSLWLNILPPLGFPSKTLLMHLNFNGPFIYNKPMKLLFIW